MGQVPCLYEHLANAAGIKLSGRLPMDMEKMI